jgi:glutathione synthase/RimK-type ligase-like ATP-grasp enzyme
MRIGLVTCRSYPTLSASDAEYARALQARNCLVKVLPWNATPLAAFADNDALVLRATWDDIQGFERWCRDIGELGLAVFNSLALACWDNDKRTLVEFGRRGVAIPKTVTLVDDTPPDAAFLELGCEWAVLKPCWGGSGTGVERIRRPTPS